MLLGVIYGVCSYSNYFQGKVYERITPPPQMMHCHSKMTERLLTVTLVNVQFYAIVYHLALIQHWSYLQNLWCLIDGYS